MIDEEDYFVSESDEFDYTNKGYGCEDEFDDPDWEDSVMDAMYPEGYDEDIDGYPFGDD
jgi:hypothetical protein